MPISKYSAGILFFVASFGEWVIAKVLDWTITILPYLSLSDIIFIVGSTIAGILIVCGRLGSKKKIAKPNFNHVEARLFYSKDYSSGDRDPNRHEPQQKLVLVTDLKKAYCNIGNKVWKLIQRGKIKFPKSEDIQNLENWCKKHGYTLISNKIATKKELLEPYFEAEIRDKKPEYYRGDEVFFRTQYRGKLTHGFFDNEIKHSEEDKLFPKRRFYYREMRNRFCWSPDTLSNYVRLRFIGRFFKGKLNGYGYFPSDWNWRIPDNAPKGEYRIIMRVYDKNSVAVREKEETIIVV